MEGAAHRASVEATTRPPPSSLPVPSCSSPSPFPQFFPPPFQESPAKWRIRRMRAGADQIEPDQRIRRNWAFCRRLPSRGEVRWGVRRTERAQKQLRALQPPHRHRHTGTATPAPPRRHLRALRIVPVFPSFLLFSVISALLRHSCAGRNPRDPQAPYPPQHPDGPPAVAQERRRASAAVRATLARAGFLPAQE